MFEKKIINWLKKSKLNVKTFLLVWQFVLIRKVKVKILLTFLKPAGDGFYDKFIADNSNFEDDINHRLI